MNVKTGSWKRQPRDIEMDADGSLCGLRRADPSIWG